MILPGAILLTWIKSFRTIAPTSIVANVLISYGLISILGTSPCLTCHGDTPAALLLRRGQPRLAAARPRVTITPFFSLKVYNIKNLGHSVQVDPTCHSTSSNSTASPVRQDADSVKHISSLLSYYILLFYR